MTVKKQSQPDWQDIRVFVALTRYGSLSATARALDITHATVARRLRSLEQSLGQKLLERRPDGYRLTAAGQQEIAHAIAMETACSRLGKARAHADDPVQGLVRLNAPPSLLHTVLVAQLAQLALQHPGLELDLVGDVRTVSLERRETDLGLRFEKPQDGDVIAHRLCEVAYAFYGRKRWHKLRDGELPPLIGFDEANRHLPEARWLLSQFPQARYVLRTSSHLTQAQAAASGLGVALLPHFVSRGLHVCELGRSVPSRSLWLVKRRQDRNNQAVQAVWEYLIRYFEQAAADFSPP